MPKTDKKLVEVARALYERDVAAVPIKYPVVWEDLVPVSKDGYYKQAEILIPIIRKAVEAEEASEIVRGAFGRRPDLPSGKDYVDEVRGHKLDRPYWVKIAKKIREKVSICNTCKLLHYEEPFCIDCCGVKADQIMSLIPDEKEIRKAVAEEIIKFIESYLVTTVDPILGDMHHIDDKEWQSVKMRLLRKYCSGKG